MKLDQLYPLTEAGIITADVSRAVSHSLFTTMEAVAKVILTHIPTHDSPEDRFDAAGAEVTARPNTYARTIADTLAEELTRLLVAQVHNQFPELNDFDPRRSPVHVHLMVSNVKNTLVNGTFDPRSLQIMVHCTTGQIITSLLDHLAYAAGGEIPSDSYVKFSKFLTGVLIHEYTHLEQCIRSRGNFDQKSYITGTRQADSEISHAINPADFLVYKGQKIEIDAFSSEAALEIASVVRDSDLDYNENIKYLRNALAQGSADSTVAQEYREIVQASFRGDFARYNLNPQQMQQVWKRFAKQVYVKVGAYLKPTNGKADPRESARMNKNWVRLANKHPQAPMIAFLARRVAQTIAEELQDHPDRKFKLEDIRGRAANGFASERQWKSEMFILQYYMGEFAPESPKARKTIEVFRRLVDKNLRAEMDG